MNSIFDEPLPIKDFNDSNIDEFILKINEANDYHGERKCLEEKIKGQKLFKSKFINDFEFALDNCTVRVAAKVRAEMKKTSYDVNLVIASNNEIFHVKMSADYSVVEHFGGCHCGAIRFTATASSKVKVYVCNCSICVKKQLKGFIVPRKDFKLLQGEDSLELYTFNTKNAKHYFCSTCGVQSFYEPRSNPGSISVMTYCIDSGTIDSIEEIPFDGKNWEDSIKKEIPSHS